MKYAFIIVIILMAMINLVYHQKLDEQKETMKVLEEYIFYHNLQDSLNLNIPHIVKSELRLEQSESDMFSIIIIIPPNICSTCLENELSTIKNNLGEKYMVTFVTSYSYSKNIEILINRNGLVNCNLIKNNKIVSHFANFEVPIISYRGFYFIPMKNSNALSTMFYSKISSKQ